MKTEQIKTLFAMGLFVASPKFRSFFRHLISFVFIVSGLVVQVAFLRADEPLRYNRRLWNEMRRRLEYGTLYEKRIPTRPVSDIPPPAPPPGLTVELPYDAAISISGRKLIAVNLKTTQYLNPEEARAKNIVPSRTDVGMDQELQVRIRGQVGRKTHVNIDFDDTVAARRDISIVYRGDPEEVVQKAAFGDITVALPQTEFTGYARQLFGAKVDTRFHNMRFMGFASQTKGRSEVRRFTGNTALERREIADISYIRFRYYQLVFGTDTIRRGTERIFLDDRNFANNNINTSSMTVHSLVDNTTFFGDFDLLIPGQDYSVDYGRGVISFRRRIGVNYVIAVDYQRDDGSFKRDVGAVRAPKIIKDEANVRTTELKNHYSIGRNRIIRDDGRGNFILKIQDLNRSDVATIGGRPVPRYPQDIVVDFEQGFFYFREARPFLPEAYKPSPVSSYRIFLEYRYRFRTFHLRPGIVPHSEKVIMDGKTLTRDVDYMIDYNSGFITFHHEERITEQTVIEISYDYTLFGAAGGSTIAGLRGEVALTPNIFFGSTFIYEFAAQREALPDIKSPPSSLSLFGVDSRIMNVRIPLLGWNLSLSGEVAQNRKDPNTVGRALIESMEGIKKDSNVSTFRDLWRYAAIDHRYRSTDITWANEEVLLRDINPNIDPSVVERRQILVINYDTRVSSQAALVHTLSRIGLDFSRKRYLSGWIRSDRPVTVALDVGSLREDINFNGVLDTEDKNRDGVLNLGEDIGIRFINPDGSVTIIGAGNGILDTEDLDADGFLRTIDSLAGTFTHEILVAGRWEYFTIPIVIAPGDELRWQSVKQARLRVKTAQSGVIRVAQLTFSGNRWEAGFATPGSTITVRAINNEEHPRYVSLLHHPVYQSLYDITGPARHRREQALSLRYDISAGTVSTRLIYMRPSDFSHHRKLKFFLYGDARGAEFFIQAGNEANYFEFSVPVNWSGWRVITLRQTDINRDGTPDRWESDEVGSNVKIVGQPNLNNISQLKAGVRSAGVVSGELWLNEIFAQDTFKREGLAYRYNVDLDIPGWAALGGRKREVTRDFQSFTGGIHNQDRVEDSFYFNMPQFWLFKPGFLRWISMPLNTAFSRTLTQTPSAIQAQEGLVSILAEGRVLNLTGSAESSLSIPHLPKLSGRYSRSITDTAQIKRLEDSENISGNVSYTPPRFIFFPTSISAGYTLGRSYLRPWRPVAREEEYLEIREFLSLQESRGWNAQAPFQFWDFLSLSPSYSILDVTNQRRDLVLRDGISRRYFVSQNQTAALSGTLRVFNFFQPGFSYSVNTTENYNLQFSTVPLIYPGETKAIIRAGSAELTWNFDFRDITALPFTRTLGFNTSFRISDGSSYDNVPSTFNARDRFWFRDEIKELTHKRRTLTQSDTLRISGRWNPLEHFEFGNRLSPLRTLRTNFTYSRSDEFSDMTGTQRKSYTLNWPDMVFTLSEAERLIFLERFTTNTVINFRTTLRESETLGQSHSENSQFGVEYRTNLLGKYDISSNYNQTAAEDRDLRLNQITRTASSYAYGIQAGFMLGKWRFTARYDVSQESAKDGLGRITADSTSRRPGITAMWDYISPGGIRLPLIGQTLALTNRLTFTTNFNLAMNRSSINYREGNTDVYNFNFTGDYEATPNFRVAIGGGMALHRNLVRKYKDHYSINVNSRLTIQF